MKSERARPALGGGVGWGVYYDESFHSIAALFPIRKGVRSESARARNLHLSALCAPNGGVTRGGESFQIQKPFHNFQITKSCPATVPALSINLLSAPKYRPLLLELVQDSIVSFAECTRQPKFRVLLFFKRVGSPAFLSNFLSCRSPNPNHDPIDAAAAFPYLPVPFLCPALFLNQS